MTFPTCGPVNEIARRPAAWIAMASSAMETCSPVASSISISRSGGSGSIWVASSTSSSVKSPIAETTATTRLPASAAVTIRLATARMRSGVPTDVPPYFWTMIAMRAFQAPGGPGGRACEW